MFGTLIHGSQDKEQLTFVENTDPESALSRNRRDKRHISCKSCRARKVRCSGQPEGCGRCAAMSIECQYPGRESRQRKRSSGRQSIGAFNTAGTVSSSGASALDNQRKPNQGLIQEQDEYRQQEQMDQRLPGSPPENSNLEGSARTAPEDWLDINNFINPIMMMTPLANINDGINIMNEVGGSSVSGDGDSSNDFDIETDTPVSSFPSPDAVAQSLLLPSSYDCFSGVASSDQSTRNLQSKSANARSNTTNNDANQPQHRSPHIPDTTGYLPSWSPRSPKNSPVLLMTPVSSGTQRQTPSMQSTERNHAKDGCKCLHLTACLLEKLGAEKVRDETTALDALLGCFRRGLVQYNTILGCDRCVSLSENNMLLVMAGQYMGAICQRIVMTYLGLQRGHNQHEQTVIPAGGWNTDGSGFEWNSEGDRGNSTDITVSAKGKGPRTAGDMWFCSYRIESGSERMQVLRCLITVQVTEFTQILEKLRARAGNRREHLMLLTGTEKRIKRIRRLLYDNFNWSLDGGI